ncbi:hypothetical protein EYZ11_000367 [Aspergillus tanneri]|uniref:EthD domain-containing protein n=1 Tax=Aspergillus tanneri TaxID=1220188 RepID=A0A4S3JXF4_9EURO|nr:uncharacterized protein ATNIH1004_004317 [Aspergillus tanneri]KAA8648432.1 hypothetical protein ATNIH1004_004317 [Aspergillus tanneri]THD00176.1 hypothetical protein EYZ11_000367 [Aspergillus tanneri]
MPKDLTFNVHYTDEFSHNFYGDGKKLAGNMREIYHDQNIEFPDDFDSTMTVPPVHFMQVSASDDVDVEKLKAVHVPAGLDVEIHEWHM